MLAPVVPASVRDRADRSQAAPIDLTERRRTSTQRVDS
jgi:hypothetical protein